MKHQQKPTIGRIVVYNHPGSADGKYPPTQSPAIVQSVADDGSVRLWVFGPKGLHSDAGLTQGDGSSQWNWPVRDENVKDRLQDIAVMVDGELPVGWGMMVFAFPYNDPQGRIHYVSKIPRKDAILMLDTWLKHQNENPQDWSKHL